MSDLYEDDILLWSEHQTELLRCIAAGEPVNERPDWVNIIEEVASVGCEQLHAVESLLFQARRRFVPSMRRNIDVAGLHADALKALPARMDGQPPRPLSPTCAMTLDELLG